MGLGLRDTDEVSEMLEQRRRERPDLDKLADDDAMQQVRKELLNATTGSSQLQQIAFNLLHQIEPVLKGPGTLGGDSAEGQRLRSVVDELKANVNGGYGKMTTDSLRGAIQVIDDRKADYGLRTDRLKLEKARADVAAVVVESYPLGVTGKLGAQIGAALLASGAASAAILQASGFGVTANYAISGLAATVGIAILFTSFLFMFYRESEKRLKYDKILGDIVIHEPPRSGTEKVDEPPAPGFLERWLENRRVRRWDARGRPASAPPPAADDRKT